MELGGWRTGSELQHISSWQKNVFSILNSVPQGCCYFHLLLWGIVCKLCIPPHTDPHNPFLVSFTLIQSSPTQTNTDDVRLLEEHCSAVPVRKAAALQTLGSASPWCFSNHKLLRPCKTISALCKIHSAIWKYFSFIFYLSPISSRTPPRDADKSLSKKGEKTRKP